MSIDPKYIHLYILPLQSTQSIDPIFVGTSPHILPTAYELACLHIHNVHILIYNIHVQICYQCPNLESCLHPDEWKLGDEAKSPCRARLQ